MFIYQGWIVIRSAPHETETESEDTVAAGRQVRDMVDGGLGAPGLCDYRVTNGQHQLHVGGMTNHRNATVLGIIDAYRTIAEIAPGSFGLLHVWDDETEHPNRFDVFVLKRGELTQHEDVHLSPPWPTLETPG